MTAIKNFFKIETAYQFEMNDLRAIIQIINVTLIMIFGLSVSWFGLALAIFHFLIILYRIAGQITIGRIYKNRGGNLLILTIDKNAARDVPSARRQIAGVM